MSTDKSMNFTNILAKSHFTVLKTVTVDAGDAVTYYVRVEPEGQALWAPTIEEFLVRDDAPEDFSYDISKSLFVSNGAVRFLWRLRFFGNVQAAASDFAFAAVRARSKGTELASIPLIGRENYVYDPAAGKLKGAYAPGTDPLPLLRGGL